MRSQALSPEVMRRRNVRVGLAVTGFMLALYVLSVIGVIVLN